MRGLKRFRKEDSKTHLVFKPVDVVLKQNVKQLSNGQLSYLIQIARAERLKRVNEGLDKLKEKVRKQNKT